MCYSSGLLDLALLSRSIHGEERCEYLEILMVRIKTLRYKIAKLCLHHAPTLKNTRRNRINVLGIAQLGLREPQTPPDMRRARGRSQHRSACACTAHTTREASRACRSYPGPALPSRSSMLDVEVRRCRSPASEHQIEHRAHRRSAWAKMTSL